MRCDTMRFAKVTPPRADVESRTDWKVAEQSNQRPFVIRVATRPGSSVDGFVDGQPDWTVVHDDDHEEEETPPEFTH